MQGVVTVLEGEGAEAFASAVEGIRREFGIALTGNDAIPHLSWHVSEAYDLERLDAAVKSLARSEAPFATATAGLGLFPGDAPLVHLPVLRTPRVSLLQRVLFQEASLALKTEVSPFVTPEGWVPHVTLGQAGLTPEVAGKAVAWLLQQPIAGSLPLPISHLAIGEDTPTGQRILSRHTLQG